MYFVPSEVRAHAAMSAPPQLLTRGHVHSPLFDVRGLHLTIWIAVLWSIWAVVLWAAAFGLLLRRARRIGEGAAASGSG